MPKPADRRGILSWMLFDWANQPFQTLIVTFIFAPWFASAAVGDPVRGQALWGAAAAIAGAAVALSGPLLGAIADRAGRLKPWIAAFSAPYVLGCLGLWLATPDMAHPWLPLGFFILAFIGSEYTLLLTNALLPSLGDRAEIGRISGSGWAIGYLGGLVALIAVLLLLAPSPGGDTTLLGIPPILGLDPAAGEPARATGPLSALWYLMFALPFFLFTPDAAPRARAPGLVAGGLRDLVATVKNVRRHHSLFAFLVASMVYRDALAALFAFGGIYAAGVLGWGLFELGLFGIVAASAGALGAWIGGKADARHGPRPVIRVAIILLIVVCLVVLLTTRDSVLLIPVAPGSTLPDIVFFAAGAFLGIGGAVLQAASRTLLVHQAEGRVAGAQAFGLYALSGKVTAFIGPALIAIVTAATGSQRLGVTPVVALFLIGLVLLHWVKTEAEQPTGNPA